ncbi:MAG: Do family serine endopeptidase [Desulfobacterales bacterium]|nr:Do family serine endopeptidase [Desulfobacterales bacterium]
MSNHLNRNQTKIVCFLFVLLCFLFSLVSPQPGWSLKNERESPVVRAVRKVSPAVVNISSSYAVRKRPNPFSGFGMDPFFEEFFKDFFDPRFERRQQSASLGSGVLIDGKRGLILTNAHVIEKASKIKIVLEDEREFDAKIIGADPDSDLAVLQIDSPNRLPAIEMGSSDDLMIGETVIAIGNPFGFSHTVTTGVISALNRSVRSEEMVFHDFIQIDASINPGNSGGPLLNIEGDLIGINTAIYAKAQGIGFAIPINKAKKIIADLIEFGEVIQAWIGIRVQNLSRKLAGYLNVPDKKGVVVKAVEPGSPALKSGLKEGDIILGIDSKKIASPRDYWSIKKTYAAGDKLKARIWRNNKVKTVSIKTRVFPMERAEKLAFRTMGIRVENINRQNRNYYRLLTREGVVISEIANGSHLDRIGARPGDVIRQIDDLTISNKEDFKKAVVKYRQKQSVVILLQRGDQGYYITLRM